MICQNYTTLPRTASTRSRVLAAGMPPALAGARRLCYTVFMEYEQFKTQYGLRLDPQQEAAVRSTGTPVLLLAVPGSGKTTALIARLGYLIHCLGFRPEQLLTVTYTVAATADMRRRFADAFGQADAQRIPFRTINSLCAYILRLYEQRTGRSVFALVSDEGRLNALVSELYQRHTGEYPAESDLRDLRTQITYIKNQMLKDEDLDDLQLEGGGKIAPLYRAYCRALRENRWMDFDDQLVYALGVFRQCPDILRDLRRRFPVLCVDEAQDTSLIQHRILRLLAGDGKGLFMVGDEDQSIYGFRAAYPQALLDFEQNYPGARVLYLERNYRCTPQVVAAANNFIRLNQARRPKRMTAVRPDGAPVGQHRCRDRRDQYRALADLARRVAGGELPGTTAVLYRDNDSALPMIDLLERGSIPYRTRQMDAGFFTSRIVRDILDIVRLAQHPEDDEAFLRVYYKFNAPIARIHAQAAAAKARKEGCGAFAALRRQELSRWTDSQVQRLLTQFRLLRNDPAAEALDRILDEMGYGEYLDRNHIDRGRLTILQMLCEDVPDLARLPAKLDSLRELVQQGAGRADSGFVLSTIHSSKGLEYDRVVLADVMDGILPKVSCADGPAGFGPTQEELDALEEERRLFYVAMTRARRELTLIRIDAPGVTSSFADVLFPPPPPPAAAPPSTPRRTAALPRFTLPTGYAPPPKSDPRMAAQAKEFYQNTRVRHNAYGAGIITLREDATVTIRFENGDERRFDLMTALRAGVLHLV